MTRRTGFILLAAGGSAALLIAALGSQYLGDLVPCKLCIWQRWPHLAAVVIGVVALAWRGRLWPTLGMLAALTTAGIALYHTGVEQHWWQGPTTCTTAPLGGMSADAAFTQMMAAPLVRCDAIQWQLLGLSMAGWNMVISLGLALLWALALRER